MGNSVAINQVNRLEEERKQILVDLERLREVLKNEVDPDADEGDPDMAEHEKILVLVQTLERKMQAVEYALYQSQAGSYGVCESCGEPIDPDRLEVVPEATLCVKCKASTERNLRQLQPRSDGF